MQVTLAIVSYEEKLALGAQHRRLLPDLFAHGPQHHVLKVDITIRERLVLPLAERAVVRGYEEYEDLPDDALVRVYPLDEIVVEKIAPSATAHETSPVIYTMSGTSRVKVTLTSAA